MPHILTIHYLYPRSSDSDYYSSIYSPFTQRPEIEEDDYIPLPTVTRKYIDQPPDSILDSIPSLPYPFRVRQPVRHRSEKVENPPLSDIPSLLPLSLSSSPNKKISLQSSKRHSLGNGQIDRLITSNRQKEEQNTTSVTPETDDWLSRHNSICYSAEVTTLS
jgi:hypothetical protein